MNDKPIYVIRLESLGSEDVARVGGKNASLGEMIQNLRQAGISVPPGFATTAEAYWTFLQTNELNEKISDYLDHLKVALSVGVQKMVRSDTAGASVMFSIDTETGFSGAVLINASWGIDSISVNPDSFIPVKNHVAAAEAAGDRS